MRGVYSRRQQPCYAVRRWGGSQYLTKNLTHGPELAFNCDVKSVYTACQSARGSFSRKIAFNTTGDADSDVDLRRHSRLQTKAIPHAWMNRTRPTHPAPRITMRLARDQGLTEGWIQPGKRCTVTSPKSPWMCSSHRRQLSALQETLNNTRQVEEIEERVIIQNTHGGNCFAGLRASSLRVHCHVTNVRYL